MEIHFDFLTIRTAARLAGVKALLRLLQDAMPKFEEQEHSALLKLAREKNFDAGEYFLERDILDDKFEVWLPRFAAYSIITLLYTVLEVQLYDCIKRAEQKTNAPFRLGKTRGSRIDFYAAYLKKHCAFDAKNDKMWCELSDLRKLRNIIVHRAGTKGQLEKHRQDAARLAEKYESDLEFPASDNDWPSEVWISLGLCNRYTDSVEVFLQRVVAAAR